MSDAKTEVNEQIKQTIELEKLKRENENKTIVINSKRLAAQMDKLVRDEQDLATMKNTSYDKLSVEEMDAIIQNSEDYMEAAKYSLTFIAKNTFKGVISFFRKNFIVIFGQTGEGKSTAVSNIVASVLGQKIGDRHAKILVLSNEEAQEDVYNRVGCHIKGWHYVDHGMFTQAQRNELNRITRYLGESGRLTVIADHHRGADGTTTTLEGITNIFNNLIRDNTQYDVILLDYYQKVDTSKQFPMLRDFEVQARLTTFIDNFKNIYAAPIVVMAQIRPPDKNGTLPEHRIKGSKTILVKATCAVEMIKQPDRLRTAWKLLKGRFTQFLGQEVYTGFDSGKFVEYTKEFQIKAAHIMEERSKARLSEEVGVDLENSENKEIVDGNKAE